MLRIQAISCHMGLVGIVMANFDMSGVFLAKA